MHVFHLLHDETLSPNCNPTANCCVCRDVSGECDLRLENAERMRVRIVDAMVDRDYNEKRN